MLATEDKKVLADLKVILDSLGLPMLIVGAGARLLVFDRQYNIQGRSTKDWDIATSVENWFAYKALQKRMTEGEQPLFKTTKTFHRFVHIETDMFIDIVPFGKISEPDQQIEWLDSCNSMNVAGFAEALQDASIETIDGLELRVINTPAYVVLKLFAWGDRGESTQKDLEDIDFILTKYMDDERVYGELAEELSTGELEYLHAAIYLLGQDIKKIFQDKTVSQLNALLERLVPGSEDETDYERDSLKHRLRVLYKGINRATSG